MIRSERVGHQLMVRVATAYYRDSWVTLLDSSLLVPGTEFRLLSLSLYANSLAAVVTEIQIIWGGANAHFIRSFSVPALQNRRVGFTFVEVGNIVATGVAATEQLLQVRTSAPVGIDQPAVLWYESHGSVP